MIVPGSHSQLLSLDTHPHTQVLVTGSNSGIVSMWDCETNKKVSRALCDVPMPKALLLIGALWLGAVV